MVGITRGYVDYEVHASFWPTICNRTQNQAGTNNLAVARITGPSSSATAIAMSSIWSNPGGETEQLLHQVLDKRLHVGQQQDNRTAFLTWQLKGFQALLQRKDVQKVDFHACMWKSSITNSSRPNCKALRILQRQYNR